MSNKVDICFIYISHYIRYIFDKYVCRYYFLFWPFWNTCVFQKGQNSDFGPSGTPSLALLEHVCVPEGPKTPILALLEHHHCSRRAILEKYMSNKVDICFIYTSHYIRYIVDKYMFWYYFLIWPFWNTVASEVLSHIIFLQSAPCPTKGQASLVNHFHIIQSKSNFFPLKH